MRFEHPQIVFQRRERFQRQSGGRCLDSIEILEGTSVELLDRAALDALRAALPFPALPADFPGDLLEITFEFVYDD
jgi:TonB family protein